MTSPLLDKIRDGLERQREALKHDYPTAVKMHLDGSEIVVRYEQGFEHGCDSRTEIILKLVEALENIGSVNKKHFEERPLYWAAAIVTEADEALNSLFKELGCAE